MERTAAKIRELRESILQRPGMYFGTIRPNDDALSPWLGAWSLDVLRAGTRRLSVSVRESGEIHLRHEAIAVDSYWQDFVVATSSAHEMQSSDGDLLHVFRPDLAVFPMLAPRGPQRLMTVLRDAVTAFPAAVVEFEDERTKVHLRLRYPEGCADRLLEECGLRSLGPRLSFRGNVDGVNYDVALAWANGPGLQVVALTNGARNANGGSHVYGVWEGVATALESRLRSEGAKDATCRPEELPRNAIVVVSVRMESPKFGPATRDCLHDPRARVVIRDAVAASFFSELGERAALGNEPPWQTLAAVHLDTPWLERLAVELSDRTGDAEPVFSDPYAHREDHDDADLTDEG